MTHHAIPTIRLFRARRGETPDEARLGRAELITLDPQDLLHIITRCRTTLDAREVASVRDAIRRFPAGVAADLVLASGSVHVSVREVALEAALSD